MAAVAIESIDKFSLGFRENYLEALCLPVAVAQEWVEAHLDKGSASGKGRGRPKGSGAIDDSTALAEMKRLLKNKKVGSDWEAARKAAISAPGGGSEESTARRIYRKHRKELVQ